MKPRHKVTARKITEAVVGGIVVGGALWESWTLANDQEADTISEAIWDVSDSHGLVPFSGGMLAGHWWGDRNNIIKFAAGFLAARWVFRRLGEKQHETQKASRT